MVLVRILSDPPGTIFCSSILRLLNVTFCMEESAPTLKGTVQAYATPAIDLTQKLPRPLLQSLMGRHFFRCRRWVY